MKVCAVSEGAHSANERRVVCLASGVTVVAQSEVPKSRMAEPSVCHSCAALELELPPSRVVYIGDTTKDALAAQAAGMHFIGADWGGFEDMTQVPSPHHKYVDQNFGMTEIFPTFSDTILMPT